jgi:hypothetical protein
MDPMPDDATMLQTLRARWLEVLDELERSHRTAWLALFDARLASLESGMVNLDFSDRDKFAGAHTFDVNQRPDYLQALSDAVSARLGMQVSFTVKSITRE